MKKFIVLLGSLFIASAPGASELVYRPINPNFGGNPLNGTYLLGNAQAQNDYDDPDRATRSQPTALDRFTSSLESRLLSQLLADVGNGNEGTLSTSDFIVDIQDVGGVLEILITDKNTSETTEIEVNGLIPD